MTTSSNHQSVIARFAARFHLEQQQVFPLLRQLLPGISESSLDQARLQPFLQMAEQFNLNPFNREIYPVISDTGLVQSFVGVDGWIRLVNDHHAYDGMTFVCADDWVTIPGARPAPQWIACTIYRKDRTHAITVREYLDEAYRPTSGGIPGESAGPWQTHTKRMLRHRSMVQAARLAFGFSGLIDGEQMLMESTADAATQHQKPVSDDVLAALTRTARQLIDKARHSGAWHSAADWINERYSGAEKQWLLSALDKARLSIKPATDESNLHRGDQDANH